MERDSKRKAPATPGADGDARASKRQRVPTGVDFANETASSTTEVGLKFVESLKNAKDKTGRPIATEFLTLPDQKLYPAYYEEILLPIAIDTIEEKLARQAYPTITALESDVKRMVANAKLYNDKRSPVYEDAERVRKTASNFFTKYNPAYRDPTYVAVATPIPGDLPDSPATKAPTLRTANVNMASPTKVSDSIRRDREASEEIQKNSDSADFKGKTFQQAQEQIMEELIHYVDEESGLEIFTPFNNLPPRNLTDYYQLIKNPQSLKGIYKRVRGIHGRNSPTGASDFQSWDSFEREMSLIWRNAREYNEDGSEIFELAGELEDYFHQRLTLARSQVEQPAQPKLKINMGTAPPKQSIKLKFGAARDSPSTSSRPSTPAAERGTPGVIVHNEALQRQQEMVAAGMNGGKSSSTSSQPTRNQISGSTPAFTPTPVLNSGPPSRSNQSPPVQANGVKSETEPSPALTATKSNGHPPQLASSAMPPPLNLTMRPASGSPAPSHPFNQQHHHAQIYNGPLKELVANRFRPAGETAADSILPLLQISGHPSLGLPKPFSLRIPASSRFTQQSLTITVPASHTHLLITPHVPVALTSRPYRLFVKVNDNRVSEMVKPGMERDKSRPQFEARLTRGEVTRIEVEVLAGSAEKKGGREVVELERDTVFVHVLKGGAIL